MDILCYFLLTKYLVKFDSIINYWALFRVLQASHSMLTCISPISMSTPKRLKPVREKRRTFLNCPNKIDVAVLFNLHTNLLSEFIIIIWRFYTSTYFLTHKIAAVADREDYEKNKKTWESLHCCISCIAINIVTSAATSWR